MIEQLLAVIALGTSITAGGVVMLATMLWLRPLDPAPPPRAARISERKDVH